MIYRSHWGTDSQPTCSSEHTVARTRNEAPQMAKPRMMADRMRAEVDICTAV